VDDESGTSRDSVITEEMRNDHVLRQAKLGRELQEVNNMLIEKQKLVGQMRMNDEQMQVMRAQYEVRYWHTPFTPTHLPRGSIRGEISTHSHRPQHLSNSPPPQTFPTSLLLTEAGRTDEDER